MFTGYLMNLLSVPLLAWAGYWQAAVVIMVEERRGKAILRLRKCKRATNSVGRLQFFIIFQWPVLSLPNSVNVMNVQSY